MKVEKGEKFQFAFGFLGREESGYKTRMEETVCLEELCCMRVFFVFVYWIQKLIYFILRLPG